jgi:hypothetical protein
VCSSDLFARDFAVSFADEVTSQVEFKWPEGWEYYSQTTAEKKGKFELLPDVDHFFYATSRLVEKILWPRLNLRCVYSESSNEETDLILGDLKKQYFSLQEEERVRKNRNLLLLFEGFKPLPSPDIFSPLQNILVIQLQEHETGDYSRRLARKRSLAYALAGFFYPEIESAKALAPDSANLFHYLSWKNLLKCGDISREDFLERMAEGIHLSSGRKNAKPAFQTASANEAIDPIQSVLVEGLSRYFLMDLWLECFGRQNKNLPDLLSKMRAADLEEPDFSVPWIQQFQQERKAGHYAQILFGDAPVPVKDLLQPFGLILFQRNIPSFLFLLSEACLVEKITENRPSELKLGDRIVAIEGDPLYSPVDLPKLRSIYNSGQTANLTVERNGLILKIPYRLMPTYYSRLELNRLADSDKLEKVDKFLAKAKIEP